MGKIHINHRGEPGQCNAKTMCPFGGDEEHYSSRQEARDAFESKMDGSFGTPSDEVIAMRKVREEKEIASEYEEAAEQSGLSRDLLASISLAEEDTDLELVAKQDRALSFIRQGSVVSAVQALDASLAIQAEIQNRAGSSAGTTYDGGAKLASNAYVSLPAANNATALFAPRENEPILSSVFASAREKQKV